MEQFELALQYVNAQAIKTPKKKAIIKFLFFLNKFILFYQKLLSIS